jgi:ketosteroid isomerase-like protein
MSIETDAAEVQGLIETLEAASGRFRSGNPEGFRHLYEDWEGVTLFGAMGGWAQGKGCVDTVTARAAAQLGVGGTAKYRVLAAQVEGNFAYLAAIEQIDTPGQEVALRTTHVFWRTQQGWKLLHRHADPLRQSPFVAE